MIRILIVDDDEQVRCFMREVLESSGYEVAEAGNGYEALQMQEMSPASMVITDIFMPVMEGVQTICEFRRRFQGTRIIAMSGGSELGLGDYLAEAEAFGADATMPKPVRMDTLLSLTAGLLQMKSLAS